jgi:hypothetical protein
MKISNAKNSLGVVKVNILHHLHKNGRTKVLDLEMALSRGDLRAPVASLVSQCYVMRVQDNCFTGIAITNAGRAAIGIEVDEEITHRPTRFCNASMNKPLDHVKDVCMGRVGLARFGAAQRAGVAV